jgi:ADP-ribose pyrophosphatase YjhB (NUDIX family)
MDHLLCRVEAVIFHKKEKLLLARHEKLERSYWVLPGGSVQFGESLDFALRRELFEELNFDEVIVNELLFVDQFIDLDHKRHVVKIGFTVTIPEDEFEELSVSAQADVIKDIREFTLEEIRDSADTFYPSKDFLLNMFEAAAGND